MTHSTWTCHRGRALSLGMIALAIVGGSLAGPALAAQSHKHKADVPKKPGITEDDKILHVLNRLGFGARPEDVEKVRQIGLDRYIEQQLHPELIDDSAVDQKLATYSELQLTDPDIEAKYTDFITADQSFNRLRGRLVRMEAQRELTSQATNGAPMDNMQTQAGATTGATTGAAAGAATGTAAGTAPMTTGAPAQAGAAKVGFAAKRDAILDMVNSDPALQQEFNTDRQQLATTAGPIGLLHQQFVAAKLIRAAESQKQLQEVLVDFWTNHFNIDIRKAPCGVLKVIDDRDVIRAHVFGKFRDMLEASAKSPAMLVYLDNFQSVADNLPQPNQLPFRRRRLGQGLGQGQFGQGGFTGAQGAPGQPAQTPPAQPKRPKPGLNENYAREIMELHTLGVNGGYTQQDVREVARCLTGWGIANPDGKRTRINRYAEAGEFEFYPRLHDDGPKTVLGNTISAGGGIQDGEEVLDILSHDPHTMRHVSYELCQRLVCDEPPMSLVDKCVDTWKRTDGDLREIYRTVVTSPEFYSPQAMHEKIKSPFEYAISSVRALNGTLDPAALIQTRPAQVAREANSLVRPPQGGGFLDIGTTTLLGQIETMGEPLFQYQAPTGFPEDSQKWVSSGALISRLNFSLALTQNRIKDVKFDDPSEDANPSMDPAAVIDRLADRILHGEMTASTKATLLAEAKPGPNGASTLTPATITALLLGSPEFQRR